jgi:hypothetical protein
LPLKTKLLHKPAFATQSTALQYNKDSAQRAATLSQQERNAPLPQPPMRSNKQNSPRPLQWLAPCYNVLHSVAPRCNVLHRHVARSCSKARMRGATLASSSPAASARRYRRRYACDAHAVLRRRMVCCNEVRYVACFAVLEHSVARRNTAHHAASQ